MGILTALVSILPFVGQAVSAVETLFGGGNGATKKKAAMGIISAGLDAYGTATGNQLVLSGAPELEAAISAAIDAIVAVNNALGIFRSSKKPATAAAPAA